VHADVETAAAPPDEWFHLDALDRELAASPEQLVTVGGPADGDAGGCATGDQVERGPEIREAPEFLLSLEIRQVLCQVRLRRQRDRWDGCWGDGLDQLAHAPDRLRLGKPKQATREVHASIVSGKAKRLLSRLAGRGSRIAQECRRLTSLPIGRCRGHRLLRHTYQEGPDFLFLATRGGRPPVRPPDTGLAEVRLRARCVRVAREEGIGAALAIGASRASLHRWRTRYEAGGLEALVDRPRGPAPSCLPDWVEQAVIVLRLLTYRNSKRLAAEFTRREIFPLDHHAVDRLLGDLGTARPSTRRERGPAYERGRPNELWHIDIKGGCTECSTADSCTGTRP
jgi:Homeodomain-like domain